MQSTDHEARSFRGLGLCLLAIIGVVWLSSQPNAPQAEAVETAAPRVELPAYSAADTSRIVDDSRNNSPRFDRDFKGRRFAADLRFESVTDGYFGKMHVAFKGAYCFTDKAQAQRMIDWRTGMIVHVTGRISTTMFGDVQLDECTYQPK